MARKSERTRQRIVEAANRLFYHKGYNRTSFTDVVEAANVPRGNIYYYFKTKDEILLAALEYREQRIAKMLNDWSGSYRTPIERLHRFLNILTNTTESLIRNGCPMGTLNAELGKEQHELQESAENLFKLFENWVTDQFAELGYAGRAHELALSLVGQAQGINMLAHVHHDADFLKREKERLDRWVEMLAAGTDNCS